MVEITDTIVGISTPFGEAPWGIIRVSGPRALYISEILFSPSNRELYKNMIKSKTAYASFDGILTYKGDIGIFCRLYIMKAPFSYTREDVIEFHTLGPHFILDEIVEKCTELGARIAEPGEFTKRAFLNGRISLNQAEAVMKLIEARSEKEASLAMFEMSGSFTQTVEEVYKQISEIRVHITAGVDFEDELIEIDFQKVIDSLNKIHTLLNNYINYIEDTDRGYNYPSVILIGPANAGKSSIFNLLIGEDRAIVDSTPGTTRDINIAEVNLCGIKINLIDTAGIKDIDNIIEREAYRKCCIFSKSSLVRILVIDGSRPITDKETESMENLISEIDLCVINKIDLNREIFPQTLRQQLRLKNSIEILEISAKHLIGMEELKEKILDRISRTNVEGTFALGGIRRKRDLLEMIKLLRSAEEILNREDIPIDLVDAYLREVAYMLGNILGKNITEDILNEIFSRFCVGK